jgi:hypothetical protein
VAAKIECIIHERLYDTMKTPTDERECEGCAVRAVTRELAWKSIGDDLVERFVGDLVDIG